MSDTSAQFPSWPAWFYGPKGQSEIFQSEEQVPEGWEDHPSKFQRGASKTATTPTPPEPSKYKDKTDAEVIEELKKRKIDHNARWPRPKLEALLVEDDKKAA